MSPPRAFVSWSSGKDSAFALYMARKSGLAEIVGVLTTTNEVVNRVAMHGVRNELLDRQVAALGLPSIKVPLPYPCPNEIYERRMAVAIEGIKAQGVRHMIFGDLFLEDVRAYREARLATADMIGLYPLWQRNTRSLAHDIIKSGVVAHLVCIDPKKLERKFAGRRFDEDLLTALPADCDPCGENGEFHTVVSAGPMFSAPIPISIGEVVERDGFVFADAIPERQR
jgi:uncharacterized protein (TIGR00290 family)